MKQWLDPIASIEALCDDLDVLAELVGEQDDAETLVEIDDGLLKLARSLDRLESQFLLSGPDDARGALLEIHPGAGGPTVRTGRRCFCACMHAIWSVAT